MKTVFLTDIRKMEVRQAPEPQIQRPDDVLMRVETVGVCGSDIHYFVSGRIGQQVVKFPWIVGHECSGIVQEIGPAVKGLKKGQRVAVDPLIPCGRCDQCAAGRPHTCRSQKFLGVPGQLEGCLSEYLVMPGECLYPAPGGMNGVRTALIEPLAIGLYSQRVGGDPGGKKVAILGNGPIGLCVLLSLRAAAAASGGCTVYCTDLIDERLAVAGRLGADWTGNPNKQDVVAEILRREPAGVDLVFECCGKQETVDQSGRLLRPGCKMVLVGIPEFDRFSFDMNYWRRKELTIRNVRRQNNTTADAIQMVADGRINVDPLATHSFTLDQTAEAFDLVADYRDGVVRAMVNL